ncbi:GNAT family N-acetyltransferase [Vitiosangium sp. GDMCC 1.1324]|uniref:GNAT family N-acetyltransferase n=1 Tax=Vitiosangium sp. (strain GDMCC 1.1324) TaxID=2138576 RepID=UPI00130E873E|nr:GNAT family N-acetyltransferase [Vitiosangium sp. GDMCC 1.1324]
MSRHGITLRWPERLDEEEALRLIELMNAVIERDPIIGFSSSIDRESGLELMADVDHDVAKGNSHLLLASARDRRLLGMGLLRQSKLPHCRHLVEVQIGFIHPSVRGGGLLEAMFSEIVRKCQTLGAELLMIDVQEGTRSERLWRVFGFRPYGRLEDYAREGQRTHAGIYMYQYVADLAKRLGPDTEHP